MGIGLKKTEAALAVCDQSNRLVGSCPRVSEKQTDVGRLSCYQDPPAKPWALGQPPMRPADKRLAEWLPRLELHYERPRLFPVIFHHLQVEEIPYDTTEPGNSSLRQVLPVPRLTRFCCSR
ncbi:hypothetical protein SRHO_G00004370 [Serrasalmus rhombeus]